MKARRHTASNSTERASATSETPTPRKSHSLDSCHEINGNAFLNDFDDDTLDILINAALDPALAVDSTTPPGAFARVGAWEVNILKSDTYSLKNNVRVILFVAPRSGCSSIDRGQIT